MISQYPFEAAPVCRLARVFLSSVLVAGMAFTQASASDLATNVKVAEIPAIEREVGSGLENDEAEKARQAVNQFSDQLQALKTRVVSLNKDIRVLEEDLLFPVNTQTTIFVSMNTGKYFELESVKLKINDQTVTSHLYSKQEIMALENGGVQRLYLTNLGTGQHEVTAFFTGKGPMGREFKRASTAMVDKKKGPAYVELLVTDSESKQQPEFSVQQW